MFYPQISFSGGPSCLNIGPDNTYNYAFTGGSYARLSAISKLTHADLLTYSSINFPANATTALANYYGNPIIEPISFILPAAQGNVHPYIQFIWGDIYGGQVIEIDNATASAVTYNWDDILSGWMLANPTLDFHPYGQVGQFWPYKFVTGCKNVGGTAQNGLSFTFRAMYKA
jgi:hypothetical protein